MTTMKVWDGTAWQVTSLPVTQTSPTWVGPEAPTGTPTTGDLWYDTDNENLLPLPVSVGQGGTGAVTAGAARTNLGVNLPLGVVDGGTGGTTAAGARSSLAVPAIGNSAVTAGAPTTGTWARGDTWLDSGGIQWVCVTAGTPGTWKSPTGAWTTYTPTLSASASVGNGSLTGRYMLSGKTCSMMARANFGTTGISGGNGVVTFSLPVTAAIPIGDTTQGTCALYAPSNGSFAGIALLWSATQIGLILPGSPTVSISNWWQSTDGGGGTAAGIPNVSPSYNVQANGFAWVAATYEIA